MKPRTVDYSARQLAEKVGASIVGDGDLRVTTIASIAAPRPGALTFVRARSNSAALRTLRGLSKMAVLVEESLVPPIGARESLDCTLLVVAHPQRAFIDLTSDFFEAERLPRTVHATASIDPSAQIGRDVSIGALCVVGSGAIVEDGATLHPQVTLYRDTRIGSNTELHSGVIIREGCIVGNNCIIHNNTVIGADGFGYIADPTTGLRKVPQVGIVSIGDFVEIGAGTAIDRATVGATTIGNHTKIDNHVQIGHNVVVGSHCLLCAQVGIAGSATLGDQIVLGGGTGVADHVTIVSGVRVGGHSGVTGDIDEPGDYLGMPAVKASLYRRQHAALKRFATDSRRRKE
jgi:UDP-3-O-[3-hydroxymyristoyl] glucosamine N-acyltransferase